MKKFYICISMVIAALTAGAATITDTFTTANFVEGTTTSYVDLGNYTAPSGNVYNAFACAFKRGEDITFTFMSGRRTGIIATEVKDDVVARSVSFSWPGTTVGNVINVYGADEPFTVGDMYDNKGVTLLGTITKKAGDDVALGELEIPAEYNFKYVGIRPNAGVDYLKEVTFVYETAAAPAPSEYTVSTSVEGDGTITIVDASWNMYNNGSKVPAGTQLTVSANAKDGNVIESFTINGETAVNAAGENGIGQQRFQAACTADSDLDVKVVFKAAAAPKAVVTYSAGENGRINCTNMTTWDPMTSGSEVAVGDLVAYNVTANGGYVIDQLTINGEAVEAAAGQRAHYDSFKIEGDTDIKVTFKSEVEEYNLNVDIEGNGAVSLYDEGFQLITTNKFVAGTKINIIPAATADGYIESFTINGVEATDETGETANGKLTILVEYTIESNTEVKVVFKSNEEPAPAGYCNNYEGVSSTHSSRYLNTVTFTSGDETLTVTAQTKYRDEIYKDKTDEVFEITPGSSINIKCNGKGEWMHGYAWVDWNRDYVFTPEIGDDHAVTANSELVAFNYYKGYDSNGASAPENSNGFLADLNFNVPEDITPGDYRFRFIIDWDCIDPCGNPNSGQSLANNGGCILDVTLRYSEPDESGVEAIESAEEVTPVYYNLQGVRVANPANGVYIKVVGEKAEKVYLSK